ncbi:MAG TPA: LysM domain-containing protein [Actinomycetota bacterium]
MPSPKDGLATLDELLRALEAQPPDLGGPRAPEALPVEPERIALERATVGIVPGIIAIVAVMAAGLSLAISIGRTPGGAESVRASAPPAVLIGLPSQPRRPASIEARVKGRTVVAPHIDVRAGDSLWKIAQRRFGDPQRWRAIWRLNRGRVMEDGSRFADPSLIRPGWTLRVPLRR